MKNISNYNYVCFKCRTSNRRGEGWAPKCTKCHQFMSMLGKHWRVPKQRDNKGWKLAKEMYDKEKL